MVDLFLPDKYPGGFIVYQFCLRFPVGDVDGTLNILEHMLLFVFFNSSRLL